MNPLDDLRYRSDTLHVSPGRKKDKSRKEKKQLKIHFLENSHWTLEKVSEFLEVLKTYAKATRIVANKETKIMFPLIVYLWCIKLWTDSFNATWITVVRTFIGHSNLCAEIHTEIYSNWKSTTATSGKIVKRRKCWKTYQ